MEVRRRNLNIEDWLQIGLKILGREGHESLRLTRLIQEAGVTSGSFYWHFQSIDEYRRALPRFWVEDFLPTLARHATETATSPKDVLERLGELIQSEGGYAIDTAMRRWADNCSYAKDALNRADKFRREVVLTAARLRGSDSEMTQKQYQLLNAAWRGSTDMRDQRARIELMAMVTEGEFKE